MPEIVALLQSIAPVISLTVLLACEENPICFSSSFIPQASPLDNFSYPE
jgi:hypothetical protein